MINKLKAFFIGAVEFRNTFTTRVNLDAELAYDSGREFAHRITLRKFEQS